LVDERSTAMVGGLRCGEKIFNHEGAKGTKKRGRGKIKIAGLSGAGAPPLRCCGGKARNEYMRWRALPSGRPPCISWPSVFLLAWRLSLCHASRDFGTTPAKDAAVHPRLAQAPSGATPGHGRESRVLKKSSPQAIETPSCDKWGRFPAVGPLAGRSGGDEASPSTSSFSLNGCRI
jgi:hypothetical protein